MGTSTPNIPIYPIYDPNSGSDSGSGNETRDTIAKYINENRGYQGTINTSWRGLLNKSDENEVKRKVLLGE